MNTKYIQKELTGLRKEKLDLLVNYLKQNGWIDKEFEEYHSDPEELYKLYAEAIEEYLYNAFSHELSEAYLDCLDVDELFK